MPAVLFHGDIYPCAALVVLDNSPYLAIDAIYLSNKLFSAVIARNFFDIFRNTVNFPLQSAPVWYRPCYIAFLCFPWNLLKFVSQEFDVLSANICYQRFFCG